MYTSEAAERGVILFAPEQLSLFSRAACDDTWCSFSWTTGMRVSSSVHWLSMRAKSVRSTTVSTFFRRSSWLPSVITELFRLDFPSTSFENSWDGEWQESSAVFYDHITYETWQLEFYSKWLYFMEKVMYCLLHQTCEYYALGLQLTFFFISSIGWLMSRLINWWLGL